MKKVIDIAVSGSFESEGHSVIFIEESKSRVVVRELYLGGGWQSNNRKWSTTRYISRPDAIDEQDVLLGLGYQRTN